MKRPRKGQPYGHFGGSKANYFLLKWASVLYHAPVALETNDNNNRRLLRRGFRLGEFDVRPLSGEISGPDGITTLRPEVMEVLLNLAAAGGDVVDDDDLVRAVWGSKARNEGRLAECISELQSCLRGGIDPLSHVRRAIEGGYHIVGSLVPYDPECEGIKETAAAYHETVRGGRFRGFVRELRRRRVFRIGAMYLMAAWLIIQVGEATFPALHIPDWVLTLIVVLAIIGFPIALLLTWAIQLTPDGLIVDLPHGGNNGRWRHAYILGVVALLVSVPFLGYYLVRPGDTPATDDTAGPLAVYASAPENSIAVLPFSNLSESAEDEYLADGLAEEILNVLVRVSQLKVAARTSAFHYKGKNEDIRTIAAQLGVRKILEGSVRRAGSQLRVTAQLINAADGFHLWSQTYDRSTEDIFAIQDEIAAKVVNALQLVLSETGEQAMSAGSTRNVSAYDFYLQGRAYLRQPVTYETAKKAEELFDNALTLDPDFARAYAGLCETYLLWFIDTRDADLFEKAEDACRRGESMDADNPEIHLALGKLYLQSGQPALAEKKFEDALSINEASVDAVTGLAKAFEETGRLAAAESNFGKAIDLQPGYWSGYNDRGTFRLRQGDIDRAIADFRRVARLSPDNGRGYNNLASAYFLKGDLESAAEAYRKAMEIAPTRSIYSNMGTMSYYLGRYEEAAQAYTEAIRLAPEDHRVWGYLGDANKQIPGKSREMREAYRKAISLAASELLINESDSGRIADLAQYHASLGDPARATRLIADALAEDPADGNVYYSAALVYAQAGDTEKAVAAVEQAILKGFPDFLVIRDPQLEPLKDNEKFQRLIQSTATP